MSENGQVKGLAAALVACQAELEPVKKDAKNDHFKNKFMSLDNLIQTTRPIFTKHGLAVTQFPTVSELGAPVLRTILLHGPTGESLEADMPLLVAGQNMQQLGASITYARRYAWAAVLGVAAEEDTDGEQPAAAEKPAAKKPRKITNAERKRLFAIATTHKVEEPVLRDIIKGVTGEESTESITIDVYKQICDLVEQQTVPF